MSENLDIKKNIEVHNINDDFLLLNEKNDWVNYRLWVDIVSNKIENYFINQENSINNLNINGKWGIGKTTIAYNVIKNLEKKNIKSKIFSLWEYEVDREPYLRILIDLMIFLNIEINKNVMKKLKFGLSIGLALPFLNIGVSAETVENKKQKNNIIFNKMMQDNDINTLIQLINEETKKNRYLIVLDELDRCAPNKISEFLSIIKNLFFKLKNIYFIICTDNDQINSMLKPNDLNNMQEKYTDKIFIQSLDLNNILNFTNLPELLKNNKLIIDFIEKIKLTDLRLISRICWFIDKWKKEEIIKYISVERLPKKYIKLQDVSWNVKYFYLFYLYFIKFAKPSNFKVLIEKINSYKMLKNRQLKEISKLEKISIDVSSLEDNYSMFHLYFSPSNFFVSLNKMQQMSAIMFDFLTQERKNELKFPLAKYSNNDYFILYLSLNHFKQLIYEQSILENKVFLEIFMNIISESNLIDSEYILWNIDFQNFEKVIFEYILFDNF